MHIDLDRHSRISLANQISQSISDRIRSGLLNRGSRLPSVRELSKDINVSIVTVLKAYSALEKEGLIDRIQGKGTYIKKEEQYCEGYEETSNVHSSVDWQLSIPDYLPRAQFWKQNHIPLNKETIKLSIASIHQSLLPIRELTKDINRITSENTTILSEYGAIHGDSELREAVASYLHRAHLPISSEDILITNGSQQGIDLVARTFVGPGDVVVMEAPTYTAAVDVFRGRGATILTVPVDKEGIRIDLLTSICDTHRPKIIYTMPTFHNPTGCVMSPTRRAQLLCIAQSYHCLIVEDDPWSEINFEKAPPPPIKKMDENGHVVYLKGFSKILAPGCRISALIASGTVFNRLIAAKASADLGSPLLTQKAVLPFIQSNRMVEHLKRLNATLYIRRKTALDLLTQHAPRDVAWTVPEGGLSIWLTLPAWLNADALLSEAHKRNISFLPGSICYAGEPEFHHIRITFSYVEEKKLKEGIITLCDVLSSAIQSKTNHIINPLF